MLDVIEERGLLDEFLFVLTSDHGMAPQDVSLAANPAWHVDRIGMAATVAEPMIWLHDLAVRVERAPDGRTGRVIVAENDRLPGGDRAPVEGAGVRVSLRRERGELRELAHGVTGAGGVFGFGVPSDASSREIELEVAHPGHNTRHLRLDGSSIAIDLVEALYGPVAEAGGP